MMRDLTKDEVRQLWTTHKQNRVKARKDYKKIVGAPGELSISNTLKSPAVFDQIEALLEQAILAGSDSVVIPTRLIIPVILLPRTDSPSGKGRRTKEPETTVATANRYWRQMPLEQGRRR